MSITRLLCVSWTGALYMNRRQMEKVWMETWGSSHHHRHHHHQHHHHHTQSPSNITVVDIFPQHCHGCCQQISALAVLGQIPSQRIQPDQRKIFKCFYNNFLTIFWPFLGTDLVHIVIVIVNNENDTWMGSCVHGTARLCETHHLYATLPPPFQSKSFRDNSNVLLISASPILPSSSCQAQNCSTLWR